jgi:hypothetical protein
MFRFYAKHSVLQVRARWKPNRYPTIAAMVVMTIAERDPLADEEARRTMAPAFADARQRQGNFAHPTKLTSSHVHNPWRAKSKGPLLFDRLLSTIFGDEESTGDRQSTPFYSTVLPPHSHSIVPGGFDVTS